MSHKILLVDNNDSFTFNIVELIRSISGKNPIVKKSNALKSLKLSNFQSIIFSPGPGLPSEFPNMTKILSCLGGKVPILGICLGHQAICEFYGLKLYRLNDVVHGQPKTINIIRDSTLFKGLPSRFDAGLYHSWVAENTSSNKFLKITSISEDDQIMSVEDSNKNIFGVQFHPESHITRFGKDILANFLQIK